MRPRIKVEKQLPDVVLEVAGILAILTTVVVTAFYWSELPDRIPSHFNAAGEPDDWSSKWIAWVLPILQVVIYAAISRLLKSPHILNYPIEITEKNAHRQYRSIGRILRFINTVVAFAFTYISWSTIRIALNEESAIGTGRWFLPVFLGLTIVIPLLIMAISNSKQSK